MLKKRGAIIGETGIRVKSGQTGTREGVLGYFLDRHFWGNGFATEAAELMIAFGFSNVRLEKIRASCDSRNIASQHVMQKCRMIKESEQSKPGRTRYSIAPEMW